MRKFFVRDVWSRELASLPTFRRWGYGTARVVHLTVTNFVKDRCAWRASALTYMTVLSLVPMLALAFSVAKGMGAYDKLLDEVIVPFLDSTFGAADGPPPDLELGLAEQASQLEAADGAAALEPADESGEGAVASPSVPDGAPQELPEAAADRDATAESSEAAPGTDEEGTEDVPMDAESAGPGAADQENANALPAEPADESTAEAAGGSEVRRAIDTVLGFVQKTDVSRLGAFGFLLVLYTAIKLLGAIELSFNDIWGVRRARSLPRKVADYFSTIVLVPLLLVTGTGVMSAARTGWLAKLTGGGENRVFVFFSSMAVVWIGFAFAYILMPNTRIRLKSALFGGIVGGTMWQLFQWAHLKLQIGVANYNAIYSTFAALPIFLFWVQSSWITVLLGAEAAAAHQNQARHGQLVRSRDFDLALKETVALRLATRVTQAFLAGEKPLNAEDLAEELGCPERTLEEVAAALERRHVVATIEFQDDVPSLVLAADPDRIRMQDLFDALKGDELPDSSLQKMQVFEGPDATVGDAFMRFRVARERSTDNLTLRELAQLAADGRAGSALADGRSGRGLESREA